MTPRPDLTVIRSRHVTVEPWKDPDAHRAQVREAKREFLAACIGPDTDLTYTEDRYVTWLLGWDDETVETLGLLMWRLRTGNPTGHTGNVT